MTIKFKKINIYDVGAIILVIALCFAAYLKFGIIEHTKIDTEMTNIEYTITFNYLRKYSVDTFKSGDTLYDTQTKMDIGKITKVEYEPAKRIIETVDGQAKTFINPDRYDVTITVEAEGLEKDTGYFANRSVELKVGSTKHVETLYIKSSGIVKSIKTK